MSIANSLSRFAEYYKRHGLVDTVRRALLASQRKLFASRMVVFYCDLREQKLRPANLSEPFHVQRLTSLNELSTEYLDQIARFWNPKLADRNIRERFAKGATLWLVQDGCRLAGYGWVLQGTTIEPYYFPLTQRDAHLFDFHVFPQYRGNGLNPYLVGCILYDLAAADRASRAFIEAAEWNKAQLSSLRKTPFRYLGSVRSFTILGHRFVSWREKQTVEAQMNENADLSNQISRTTRTNEL